MTTYTSGLLRDEHDTTTFDCGVDSLNTWLVTQARRSQEAGVTRTYVWTSPDDLRVVAYYAVTPTQVTRGDVGRANAGGYSTIPGYLLARLALDRALHGRGLGGELLFDAMEIMVKAAYSAGGKLILVDAIDARAAEFYGHYGFHPVKANPLRLAIKFATVRNALGVGAVTVDADPSIGLMSVDFHRPDGSTGVTVISPDEARRVAARITELAAGQKDVDLRAVFLEVLDRDLMAD